MVSYPASLKAGGGARSGIAPAHLLDVQDVNGNLYFWSDRACNAPLAIVGATTAQAQPPDAPAAGEFFAWCYPTQVSTFDLDSGGSTSATLDSASIEMTAGTGGEQIGHSATWSGFPGSWLPSGAVITKAIPVVIATSEGTGAFIGGGFNWPAPGDVPSGPFFGQFRAPSIGTTVAALESAAPFVSLGRSLSGTIFQTLSISFIAIAVYFEMPAGFKSSIYRPWLLDVPQFSFHRSLQTDTGSFVVQNLSGDTLSRDAEKILRASTLEGAMFIYRLWQADAEAAWIEVHGTLTMDPTGTRDLTLKGSSLINAAQDDTPLENYSETCQIDWAGRRCGSKQATECQYSFQTCQVIERPMIVLNNFEKNFGQATASLAQKTMNRRRKI